MEDGAELRRYVRELYEDLGLRLPLDKRMQHTVAGDRVPMPIGGLKRTREEKGKEKVPGSDEPPLRRARIEPQEEEQGPSKVLRLTDLPLEVQERVMMSALQPHWLWPRKLMWSIEPNALNDYMQALLADLATYTRTFASIIRTSKQLRAAVMSPAFYHAMYRWWYTQPVEGMDGRPDPATVPDDAELRQMAFPAVEISDATGLLKSDTWYEDFVKSVLDQRLQRWKVMASVRMWRILFLTRRIARTEAAQPAAGQLARASFPDGEDALEARLPGTYEELGARFPEFSRTIVAMGNKMRFFAIFMRHVLYTGVSPISGEELVGPHEYTGADWPQGTDRQKARAVRAFQTLKHLLRVHGAVAPGAMKLATKNRNGFRFFIEEPGGEPLEGLYTDNMYNVVVHTLPTFTGVPKTRDLVQSVVGTFMGEYLPIYMHTPRSFVLMVQKPIDVGLRSIFATPDEADRKTMFCLGALATNIDLKPNLMHFGNTVRLSESLLRFVDTNPMYPIFAVPHPGILAVDAGMCTFDATPNVLHPFLAAARRAIQREMSYKLENSWDKSKLDVESLPRYIQDVRERRRRREAAETTEEERRTQEFERTVLPFLEPRARKPPLGGGPKRRL